MDRKLFNGIVLGFSALVLCAMFVVGADWPLVGDSMLMHYVVWLSHHGFAPYRDIAEMNLPMSYMTEQAAMLAFGAGSIGWRLYDGSLILLTALCCVRLLRLRGVAPGLFAAAIFAAVHLQDGIHMAGQRDLLVAVLQAIAGAVLLRCDRFRPPAGEHMQRTGTLSALAWIATASALGAAAACIKPPAILFLLFTIGWQCSTLNRSELQRWKMLGAAFVGALCPIALCLLYLLHFHAVQAFTADLHGLIAYHASLERRSLPFLLGHAFSPILLFAVLAALAVTLKWKPQPFAAVETLSALAAAAGLLSYVLQGKGFPYQRYPFLVWLILLCVSRLWPADRCSTDTSAVSPLRRRIELLTTYAGISAGMILVLVFVWRSAEFSKEDPYLGLRRDLQAHSIGNADRSVQCLDTAGTCIGALFEQRVTQSTGFLYDCYLLDGSSRVVQQQRALFEREWDAHPPRLIVLTNSNCFSGERRFDKYESWPWMKAQLALFDAVAETHPNRRMHLWTRQELPYAYRILLRH